MHTMLFLMTIPGILYYLIFAYAPMFGVIIGFQDFRFSTGYLNSPWAGIKHFIAFFQGHTAWQLIRNTLLINIYGLLWGFWIPIVFALGLSELRSNGYRRVVQTVSYLPHFISNVIAVGIVFMIVGMNTGVLNMARDAMGLEKINFLSEPKYFRTIYTVCGIWQGFGWSSIIYLAAILGVDPELHEAATIDGANKAQRILHITLPCISNTVTMMLLLALGGIMSVGFERVYLMYTQLTYEVADVISTYVYRRGIANAGAVPEYSYTSAIGIFQSLVNTFMLTTFNALSRKLFQRSLF